jgi:hypothetical protein
MCNTQPLRPPDRFCNSLIQINVMPSSDYLRKRWRQFWEQYGRHQREWQEWRELPSAIRIHTPEPKQLNPGFPEELEGLACGAKTRAGTPCKLTSIYTNGRCKFHGGLSTGPTSAAGKRKAAMNGFCPKNKRTP